MSRVSGFVREMGITYMDVYGIHWLERLQSNSAFWDTPRCKTSRRGFVEQVVLNVVYQSWCWDVYSCLVEICGNMGGDDILTHAQGLGSRWRSGCWEESLLHHRFLACQRNWEIINGVGLGCLGLILLAPNFSVYFLTGNLLHSEGQKSWERLVKWDHPSWDGVRHFRRSDTMVRLGNRTIWHEQAIISNILVPSKTIHSP